MGSIEMKGGIKTVIIVCIAIIVVVTFIIVGINYYIVFNTKNNIISEEKALELQNVDCILVLGAGIWNNRPSPMLEDRLLQGIALYNKNASNKMIVSGDHGKEEYDEVNVMKQFAMEKGVNSKDIFMDHAGFSTYDSVYRAKEIFQAKKIVIVTQKYHLYRALYIAKKLGLEAYGVASDPRKYVGQSLRELREIVTRNKDFIKVMFKPQATYLGDTIPVSGNGDVTNDKNKE